MYFKKVLSLIGLLSALMFTACAGENEPPQEPSQLNLSQTDCLEKSIAPLKGYFVGSTHQQELHGFFNCSRLAIETFMRPVRGSGHPDRYSVEELANLLQAYFFKDPKKLTADFVRHIFPLKRLLLGGELAYISRGELLDLMALTYKLERWLIGLTPFFKDTGVFPVGRFHSLVQEIIPVLTRHNHSIDLLTLTQALKALQLNQGAQWINVAIEGQKLLLANGSVVQPQDWQVLLSSAADFYSAFKVITAYKKSVKNESVTPKNLSNLFIVYSRVEKQLKALLGRRPRKTLPFTEMKSFLAHLSEVISLPEGVDAQVLAGLYHWGLTRGLSKVGESSADLNSTHLRILRQEFLGWLSAEELVSDRYSDHKDRVLRPTSSAFIELQELAKGDWPLVSDQQGRLWIGDSQKEIRSTDWHTLNFKRMLMRRLLQGYSENPGSPIFQQKLSLENWQSLTVDLEFLWPVLDLNQDEVSRLSALLFMANDLLLRNSDGDLKISLVELVEGLKYIESAWWSSHYVKRIQQAIRPQLSEPFFREYKKDLLAQFPRLINALTQMTAQQEKSYWSGVFDLVKESPQQEIKTTDLLTVFLFLHYQETLVLRFDKDQDDRLNTTEALLSYDHLRPTIESLLGPEFARPMYTFMLHYGYNPLDPRYRSPATNIRWRAWRWHPKKWEIHASRLDLVNILGSLYRLL